MDKQNLVMNGQPDNAKTCLVSFKYFEFRTVQKLSCDNDKKKDPKERYCGKRRKY